MKSVYFKISDNKFHRYIYILIKFFLIEGFHVYIKFNFRFFRSLSKYSELIKKEQKVKIFFFKTPKNALVISDRKGKGHIYLSANYFNSMKRDVKNSFSIPISMHPLMYYNDLWDKEFKLSQIKIKSALFIGATSGYAIHKNNLRKHFQVTDRETLLSFLLKQDFTVVPSSQGAFASFNDDDKIIIADRKNIKVSQEELFSCFHKYYFFIAASGYIMPMCHNLVEAMSVGTIPIIEKGYAILLDPPLQHGINAVIYNGLEDLPLKINTAFAKSREELDNISINVVNYYKEYLTPKKVIEKFSTNLDSIVYLNAEEESVRLLDKE